jgi:hypothetical protein
VLRSVTPPYGLILVIVALIVGGAVAALRTPRDQR